MPNYAWDNNGWERRNKATGLPEWEQGQPVMENVRAIAHYRIRRCAGGWIREVKRGHHRSSEWYYDANLTDHEAACLIREWRREWLGKQGAWLEVVHSGKACCVWYKWNCVGQVYDSYDAAQDAAIDAVIAEEKDDG